MTSKNLPEPVIIPRSEHPISRKDIDREALKVMYRLRDAGFTAYLVGGGVRDLLLGKTPKDFDISTNARPGQLRSLFKNSRIIGRRFRLVQVFFHGGKVIEVATFRCQGEYDINQTDQLLPSNNTFGNEAEDAFRRDLSINALFYEIENFNVIDYTGGVEDLKNRVIRIVGDPERRFTRDPVRMMRAIRHAARSDFAIEEKTWQAILNNKDKLALCPVSRLRDEHFKDLRGGASRAWARLAIESGIFSVILPCYKNFFPADRQGEERQATLLNLLGVIDRLHGQGSQLSDEILLGILLLPWAQSEFELHGLKNLKGNEAFTFSRKIRTKLDEVLDYLNIKRASKEAVTLLFLNLPQFVEHDGEKGWPNWFTKKSYYQSGLLFYQIYREASGGKPVDFIEPTPPETPPPPKIKKRAKHFSGRSPAFSSKKSGVFGLRNKK
jgi:poly(A) polymerase